MYFYPEESPPIEAIKPQAGGSALEGDFVTLKNAGMAYVECHLNQANAATIKLTIEQAKDVSGTDTKAIEKVVPIYTNEDCSVGDGLTQQTDAVDFTTSADLSGKIVVFQVDPRSLDINNGFCCIRVNAEGSNAANIISARYILTNRRSNGSAVVD
ncbi:MAG: hypothetical protein GY714_32255 [Desulfobacterales bacterium]|nr:hypothetical protein [Desulfobacterales bacterium]